MKVFNQKLPVEKIVIFNPIKRNCTKCKLQLSQYNPTEECFYHIQNTIQDLENLTAQEVMEIKIDLSWIGPVETGVL
jgi:hypothetical protein